MLVNAKTSCLVIIDVQEDSTPLVLSPRKVINGAVQLVKSATVLKLPIFATEHCPAVLGGLVCDIKELIEPKHIFAKNYFAAGKDEKFMDALRKTKKKQVVIAGTNAHIGVLQTALDLKSKGYEVFIAADCISSPQEDDLETAKIRMQQNGIEIASVKTIIFEWLENSSAKEFKKICEDVIQ